ncbi:hypothetical protein [Nostoc linckia]|uniref:hypothetical protein n=1 Tax=Nostoc linckia TaxID=92942 RepID=UPI0015D4C2A3|nr:hypothetical protein [Nostoc linckia]
MGDWERGETRERGRQGRGGRQGRNFSPLSALSPLSTFPSPYLLMPYAQSLMPIRNFYRILPQKSKIYCYNQKE